MAAILTNPRKLAKSLSYRVATRRNCLSLLKKRSMRLRSLIDLLVIVMDHAAVAPGRDHRGRACLQE